MKTFMVAYNNILSHCAIFKCIEAKNEWKK